MTIGSDGLFSGMRFVPSNAWWRGSYLPGPQALNSALVAASQRRRQRDDRADVQIDVRPAVQPLADARRKRVVDRRVAERARDADAGELARVVDRALDADDRIQPQQFDGHGGVGQVDLPGAKRGDDRRRQGLDVDLEADRQRGRRIDRRDDLVHPQHVGPQLLVAEGVEAEDGLPASIVRSSSSRSFRSPSSSERPAVWFAVDGGSEPCDGERQREREYD